jgi:hypothetical protein
MASTLTPAYFGSGTLAARPAVPSLAAGASALYAATDNGHLYMWAGVAIGWKTII